jgi:hypothetical protein
MTNYLSVYANDLGLIKRDTIVPEIGLVVLNGDTLFTINRKMAEEIAIQYDSLEIVSKKLTDCREVVDSFISLQEKYQISIDKSIEIKDVMTREIDKKDKIIKSYMTIDETQRDIISNLDKEFKKAKNRNKWLTGLTIGGVSVGFTSILLLLLK